MIVIRPDTVRFGDEHWDNILRITIDRSAAQTIHAHDETGPYATLVDIPRQRITITVTQEIIAENLQSPIPSQLALLRINTGSGSDTGNKRIQCQCVVESVTNKVSDYGANRVISLLAQSDAADQDPIEITPN